MRKGFKASTGMLVMALGALFGIALVFQNCSPGGAKVDIGGSAASLSSNAEAKYSYAPIGYEQICGTSDPTQKQIVNLYVRNLHRCPTRRDLFYQFYSVLRMQSNAVTDPFAKVEQSLRSSSEYQNRVAAISSPSMMFCLSGDIYETLKDGKALAENDFDQVARTETAIFSVQCRSGQAANVTTATGRRLQDVGTTAFSAQGGLVRAVTGNALKNQIIEEYMTSLDRYPESTGLDFWAASWDVASFRNSPDVTRYQACRHPNASTTVPVDTCYSQTFGVKLCASGSFTGYEYCN
jgi:hypothetical protein